MDTGDRNLPQTLLNGEVVMTLIAIVKPGKAQPKLAFEVLKNLTDKHLLIQIVEKNQPGNITFKMDARRRPINKNNAKKPFVTKASDNHAAEPHVTEVYTPICSHTL